MDAHTEVRGHPIPDEKVSDREGLYTGTKGMTGQSRLLKQLANGWLPERAWPFLKALV